MRRLSVFALGTAGLRGWRKWRTGLAFRKLTVWVGRGDKSELVGEEVQKEAGNPGGVAESWPDSAPIALFRQEAHRRRVILQLHQEIHQRRAGHHRLHVPVGRARQYINPVRHGPLRGRRAARRHRSWRRTSKQTWRWEMRGPARSASNPLPSPATGPSPRRCPHPHPSRPSPAPRRSAGSPARAATGPVPPAAAPAPGPPAVPAGLALFSAAVPAGNAAGAETAGAGPGAEAAEPGAASGSAPEPLQLIGPVGEAANRAASASAHVTHTPGLTSHAPRFAPPTPCLLSLSRLPPPGCLPASEVPPKRPPPTRP